MSAGTQPAAAGFTLRLGQLVPEKMGVEAGSGEEGGNSDQAPGSPQKGTRGVPGWGLLPQRSPNTLAAFSIIPPGPWQRGAKSLQCARTGLGSGEAGGSQTGAMPALESEKPHGAEGPLLPGPRKQLYTVRYCARALQPLGTRDDHCHPRLTDDGRGSRSMTELLRPAAETGLPTARRPSLCLWLPAHAVSWAAR